MEAAAHQARDFDEGDAGGDGFLRFRDAGNLLSAASPGTATSPEYGSTVQMGVIGRLRSRGFLVSAWIASTADIGQADDAAFEAP